MRLLLIVTAALLLTACDIPGLGPDPRIAQREADARAIGGACRYGMRSIEDCYRLNEKASKTAIFDGWKEMDEYMRENKLEGQRTTVGEEPPALPKPAAKSPAPPPDKPKAADKPADKGPAPQDKR